MANAEHLWILNSGREEWRAWRKANPATIPDLRDAGFRDRDLSALDLENANLYGANLRGANLYGAKLSGADLSKADISGAYVVRTRLERTRFRACKVGWTVFGDVNLDSCTGLAEMVHRGPSTVGVDTLVQSRGMLPREFLRGCGVPEAVLVYVESLVRTPIQFYSCFISYSTQDEDFAEQLYADLQTKGVRCFFAPEDLKIGSRFRDEIEQSIHVHDKLLLTLRRFHQKQLGANRGGSGLRTGASGEPVRPISHSLGRHGHGYEAGLGC